MLLIPLPILEMVGPLWDFCLCRLEGMLHPRLSYSRLCTGSPRSLHVSLGIAQRVSTIGHPWSITSSPSWGPVTPRAYSVTPLRESTHEWYIGSEQRHRHPPRDWAQLCDLLLERIGSNIHLQEAQGALMSNSQGKLT